MTRHYANYELSMLAKEAGFNEECIGFYDQKEFKKLARRFGNLDLNKIFRSNYDDVVSAPQLTHLQQWVWEKYKHWVNVLEDPNGSYSAFALNHYMTEKTHISPYDALQEGLIDFLKTKTNT